MILLLIMADDFTGALDTGVQFAAHGISTRVIVEPNVDFAVYETEVLVVDTETRHLPAKKAYEIIAGLTRRAQHAGIRYIYKKTDSALRGNIGAELAAVLEASGCRQLPFLPAFPQTGRTTCGGVHYVDGVPVTKSPFGMDPFEPVKHAVITDLIAQQSNLPAKSFPALKAEDLIPQEDGILIFDATDADDLYHTGLQLMKQDGLHVMAGCAGFGAVLPELLGLAAKTARPLPNLDPRLLVVCGSVNPITQAQLDSAEQTGFTRLRLLPRQKLEPDYWQSDEGRAELVRIEEMLAANPRCIIETNDRDGNQLTADYADRLGIDRETLRVRIASSLGHLVGQIFTSPSLGTLLLTGGDTLLQCMNSINIRELEPLCELEKGVVLASFTYNGCTRHIITKSGGFGQEHLFTDLAEYIAHNENHFKQEETMRYPKLPGLTWDGTIYENEEMNTYEALIPHGGYATAHAPAMAELPSGDLLCCWFAGSYEGSADIHIICSLLPKDGVAWLPPVDISGDDTRSEQNPSLFYGPDHAVWAMYTAQLDRQEGRDNMQNTSVVRCQKSTDGGRTWGAYETIFPEEGTFCRQPIQILSNGRWIFSNWLCTDSGNDLSGDPSAFRISDDEGKTWRLVMMPKSNGHVHANVVELEPGHLVAFMRNREAYRIHRSESFDWGDTWSEPLPTPLPNNNSSVSAVRLQSGRVAVAYNPTCTPDPQPGKVAWPGLRCPVAVALSEDGGLTFPVIRYMERGEGFMGEENRTNNKQYEYPYITQSRDGMLHLAYAARTRQGIKYVRFSEQDVLGAKRERIGLYNPTAAKSS